ncbi:MAG: AMP-binding protein, partial [Polynucleobacter victoriensis]
MPGIYEQGLDKNPANFSPITPLSFIERTAKIYPNKTAVIHGSLTRTWSETYSRCRQLASSLVKAGVKVGDTVAVMLPNTPPMVEAHFGVPMVGAVLNSLNTRLDPEAIAFMLNHGEAKVVIVDPEFSLTMKKALALALAEKPRDILVIDVKDVEYT